MGVTAARIMAADNHPILPYFPPEVHNLGLPGVSTGIWGGEWNGEGKKRRCEEKKKKNRDGE